MTSLSGMLTFENGGKCWMLQLTHSIPLHRVKCWIIPPSKNLRGRKRKEGAWLPGFEALVKKLLVADLSKRFGNLKDGPADILKHKWFESYELSKLETFEVPAPYKPNMKAQKREERRDER